MKALLTGAGGQLGRELIRTCPPGVTFVALTRQELDITDPMAIGEAVKRASPDVIINAAAYTAVDKAEEEEVAAMAINRDGVANLALAAKDEGARVIHVSTDFIFDGAQEDPYREEDGANPLSIYGASKWAGECALREIFGDDRVIVRASWVYSTFGKNFVKTMLRLMRAGQELSIVSDQIGSPTWANGLSRCLWTLVGRTGERGDFHWSDSGQASWYDFACAIQEIALGVGLLDSPVKLIPVPTESYPTAARRPRFSLLDTSKTRERLGINAPHWRENLSTMLAEHRKSENMQNE